MELPVYEQVLEGLVEVPVDPDVPARIVLADPFGIAAAAEGAINAPFLHGAVAELHLLAAQGAFFLQGVLCSRQSL